MSYLDQTRRKNPVSIAAVVGVHLAVGYALLAGFGITVIPHPHGRTIIDWVPTEPPPPPTHPRQAPKVKDPTDLNPVPVPVPVPTPPIPVPVPRIDLSGPIEGSATGGGGTVAPPLPQKPDQSADAQPAKNWKNWITTEDYPPGAIRENVQGLVVISVTIGTDGRVRSCLVTQSSGSRLLDDATCRLYTLRARFTPARDADGNPTVSQRTVHYRWQIPNE